MTFSSSRYKREAGKSTVVKCRHLVLSNKFINTSPSFYFKYKLFKSYRLHQQELKKRRRRMTMNQGYHQASSSDTDKPEELERIEKKMKKIFEEKK